MGGSMEFASYEGGADLIADGHIDLFIFSVGKVASIVMNIESKAKIVVLPVEKNALNALSKAYGTETFTIEPGIYVRPAAGVPEQFHNIGIRIEDDAIVTETGCELITRGVPVKADEIEALMRD